MITEARPLSQPNDDTRANGTIVTVTGPVASDKAGVTDAHNHLWVAAVDGIGPGVPQLTDQPGILDELVDYRKAGGRTQVDSQPGGCGRDGQKLLELSRASGVHVVACTGFHLERYYPPDHWLWGADIDKARVHFVREIAEGLEETRALAQPVRAGFIKIACRPTVAASPAVLIEAAAGASLETGTLIGVHTEKGADAETIVALLQRYGIDASRLVIFHMDKRPDFGLHRDLAQQGILLEYDTFYRPKYRPDQNVWPLLEKMIAAGLEGQVAIGTDMADRALWSRLGGGPGLVGLVTRVVPRLQEIGCTPATIKRLVGENITTRLVRAARHSNNSF